MANYYASSVKWAALATWAATTAYSVGNIVKRTNTGTPRAYRCEVAGTSGGTEPTWNTNANTTTTDNGITWRCISTVSSYGWDSVLPTVGFVKAMANTGSLDTIFVDSTHVETGVALDSGGALAVSVLTSGSVPPVKADYARGAKAQITASGGTLTIQAGAYVGFDLVTDTGANSGTINCSGNNAGLILKDCLLYLKSTSSSSSITASSTLGGAVEWTDGTKVKFGGGTGQKITTNNVKLNWNTSEDSDTISSDGAMPTSLLDFSAAYNGSEICFRSLNLSGFTGTRFISNDGSRNILFENCLLADSVAEINGSSAAYGINGANVRFIDCSRVSSPTKQSAITYEKSNYRTMVSDCVLTDTPDFGSGKQSEKIKVTTDNQVGLPVHGLILKKWNDTVSALTATVRGIYFGPTLPAKQSLYLDLTYPGDSNNSLMTGVYDPSDVLDTTANSTDASNWTASVTARANSTAYNQGDIVKVASNPGKLFIKENSGSGSTGVSEPAGMATALAGDSITDSGVTWRCGIGFKVERSFTPARAGTVRGQVVLFPVSTASYYLILNPKLEIA